MALQIRELDASSEENWDAFVASSEQGTFFHRAGWKRVIEHGFRHRTHYYYAVRDGQVCGVLPLVHIKSALFGSRLVANAFCIDGAPIAQDGESLARLDEKAASLLTETNAEYVEYRNPRSLSDGWRERTDIYANFERPILENEDADLKQIPRKQRAVVRKALTGTLDFRLEDNTANFYALYAMTMRNHGTPVFSRRYIEILKAEFGRDCDVLTVFQGGQPVSSVLNFYFRDRVMPYYTGARPEARRSGAADLMYWRLMRNAYERGYGVFDFGRSKLETGPYAFKKNWGFKPTPINLSFRTKDSGPLPEVNPNNPKYRLLIAIWRKLPIAVANTLGPPISRQLG